jgi:hypothetical protein
VGEHRLVVLRPLDVPDDGVAAKCEDALVTVFPLHAVMLVLGGPKDLEDLTGAAGLAEPMPMYDDEIAHMCAWSLSHRDHLSSGGYRIAATGPQAIRAATDPASALSRGP